MIKNYSNSTKYSNAVSFIYQAARKRRFIAMSNAKEVQAELGISPAFFAVK